MTNRVFYWRQDQPLGNFGDALTVLLLDRLFEPDGPFDDVDLHLIGSVITKHRISNVIEAGLARNDRDSKAVFWGCGKKDALPLSRAAQRRCIFLAVRGPMTRDALGLAPSTPMGDSALLLPRIYQPGVDTSTAGKVLWVPHTHSEDPTAAELEGCDDFIVRRPEIPNSTEACMRFIDGIASARFVMANAMHAAIVALAYGVPFAFWSGSRIDNPFKWADFATGVGFTMDFSPSYPEGKRAFENASPMEAFSRMNTEALLEVAPLRVKPAIWTPKH